MIRLFITLAITTIGCLTGYGQQTVKSISNYIETAKANSPLLKDYRNQLQIGQAELQQLKAMYTRSRLELNGDYLFVPILVREGGKTFFRWNEQDAVDYMAMTWARAADICMSGQRGHNLFWDIRLTRWHGNNPG